MGARTQLPLAALTALLLSLALAPAALGDAFSTVYNDYRNHGRVEPCAFSEQTLKQARQEVPPDIDQYAPDFPAAIDAALQARANGACSPHSAVPAPTSTSSTPGAPAPSTPSAGGGAGSASSPPATAGPAAAATPAPPAGAAPSSAVALPVTARPARATTSSGAPAPIVALAVLAALLALTGLLWGWGRWRGFEAPWMLGAGHSLSEAGYRLEANLAEFLDWVRFGR